jgi:hypothetical protein
MGDQESNSFPTKKENLASCLEDSLNVKKPKKENGDDDAEKNYGNCCTQSIK